MSAAWLTSGTFRLVLAMSAFGEPRNLSQRPKWALFGSPRARSRSSSYLGALIHNVVGYGHANHAFALTDGKFRSLTILHRTENVGVSDGTISNPPIGKTTT